MNFDISIKFFIDFVSLLGCRLINLYSVEIYINFHIPTFLVTRQINSIFKAFAFQEHKFCSRSILFVEGWSIYEMPVDRVQDLKWFRLIIISVVQSTPFYAGNDILLEDDKPVLPGLPIRAATLPELTRLMVNVFGK